MKILFVVRRFHTNLYFAVEALLAKGHDVELLCSTEEKAEDHRHLRPTIVDPSALGWKQARDYVKRIAPDVVVVRHTRGKLRYVSYAAAMLGIRAIGYDLRPYHLRRGFIARANDFVRGKPVWRMTPVLGDSRAAPPDPHAFYIPLPVDRVPAADTRTWVDGGVVRIICVAKLGQARKQHFLLLRALERLKDRAFTLTFAGASKLAPPHATQEYRDRLDAAAQSGPLAGRIRILADVPFEEMTGLYLDHDVFVLPARREPLGFAPLEAMACGCVPILSDECGSAGVIDSGENGFVFDADSVDELAAILEGLLDDPASIARSGQNALRLARHALGPDQFVESFERMTRQLAAH